MPALPSAGLGRRSAVIGVAAAAGVASGLALDITIAATLGISSGGDAFFVAARIPLGIVQIVLVAANQTLVPVLAAAQLRRGEVGASTLTTRLLVVTALGGAALAGAVALLASPAVALTAPGMSARSAAAATDTLRVMAVLVPIGALAEVFRAALNARSSFVAPAGVHVVLNVIAVAFVFASSNPGAGTVARGYVLGAVVQLAFLAVVAHRRGFRPMGGLRIADPELARVGRLCIRPSAGAGLNPLARLTEQAVVSLLPPGSIALVNYGYRLISAIGGTVFFRSVVVAIVPSLSRAAATGDEAGMRAMTGAGLRLMVALSVPLTAFLGVLAVPLVQLGFRRGAFSAGDASLLGVVLAVYALSLVASATQRALLAPFFARLDTRTPFRNTLYGVGANVLVLSVVVQAWRTNELAVVAVAGAYGLAQVVHVAHAAIRLRVVQGPLGSGAFGLLGRLLAASALASVVLLLSGRMLGIWNVMPWTELAWRTAATGTAGVGGLAVGLVMFGGPRVRRVLVTGRPSRSRVLVAAEPDPS